jgi:hypothetical protein
MTYNLMQTIAFWVCIAIVIKSLVFGQYFPWQKDPKDKQIEGFQKMACEALELLQEYDAYAQDPVKYAKELSEMAEYSGELLKKVGVRRFKAWSYSDVRIPGVRMFTGV